MVCLKNRCLKSFKSSTLTPIWRYYLHVYTRKFVITILQFQEESFDANLRTILETALASSTPANLTPGAYGSDDEHYFLDIEMAVLGSSPADYAEHFDPTKMRDEYGMNSDDEYLKLRLKVNEKL